MKMNDLPELAVQTLRPLTLHVFGATAQGLSPQAAFDAALQGAGVARLERLRASSLIPPNARIAHCGPGTLPSDPGQLQYVVMAHMKQSRPGLQAHAGLAWVQRGDDASGLFIDLHDDERERLEHDLHAAFAAIPGLRGPAHGPVRTAFASRTCTGPPACALVIAAWNFEPWRGDRGWVVTP